MAWIQDGYWCTRVRVEGKWKIRPVHQLVWEQANGTIPKGMVVHHKDHDKLNNVLSNLELLTPGEHSRHHNDGVSRPFRGVLKYGVPDGHPGWWEAMAEKDPERHAQLKEKMRIANNARYRDDPEYREKIKAQSRLHHALVRERKKNAT